jgi:hypothetical protein
MIAFVDPVFAFAVLLMMVVNCYVIVVVVAAVVIDIAVVVFSPYSTVFANVGDFGPTQLLFCCYTVVACWLILSTPLDSMQFCIKCSS